MSIFDKIISSPVYGTGRYFVQGNYLLEVKEVKIIDSQRKVGTQYLIVACGVIESSADVFTDGDSVTWRVDLTQPSGPSNTKQFCMAVGGEVFESFTEDNVNKEFLDALVGDDQVGKGARLKAEAINIKTRAGKDFTKVTWFSSASTPSEEGE